MSKSAAENIAAVRSTPTIDYSDLPEHAQASVQRYIEHGIEPGSFTTAVICNDLTGAIRYADDINRARLHDIVSWFYNEAPAPCWGSAEKMDAWIAAREKDRSAA